jgi:hypothetical protein
MSGRQLFTIDKFRDTERPLLAVLADPKSIFMEGLKKFKRHILYTNIVNDRSAVYYTTGIMKTDPYTNLNEVKVNYLKGYEDVILDPLHPVTPQVKMSAPTTWSSAMSATMLWTKRIPFVITLMIFVPVGIVTFLLNSVIQTIRSSKRIRLHEKGLAGVQIEDYRGPLWIKEMREEVERVYENLNSSQSQYFLNADTDDEQDLELDADTSKLLARERRMSIPTQPTLALAPYQFSMIQNLDSLGWRKYPVWIHKDRHSHAALIVRMNKESFSEGHVVLGHWLAEEFII